MADVEGKREYELKNSQAIGSQFFMVNGNVNNNINFNDNINLKTYNLQHTTHNKDFTPSSLHDNMLHDLRVRILRFLQA